MDLSPLWRAPAWWLVPRTSPTPIETVPTSIASQWTMANIAAQLTPQSLAKDVSPSSWATPQAVVGGGVQALAAAAVLAVMV